MSLRKVISPILVAVAVPSQWGWFSSTSRAAALAQEGIPPSGNPNLVVKPTPAPAVRPPTAQEAQQKIDLCFRKTLALDLKRLRPVLTGDFNGDSSMDLAAVVKPRPVALAELNGDSPSWIAQDLTWSPEPELRGPPVRVEAGQALLAIVLGMEASGWRNPEAQQAYLLTGPLGADLRAVPLDEAKKALGGQVMNVFLGEVLKQTIEGRPGFILWTGSQYVWRPVAPSGRKASGAGSAPRRSRAH